MALYTREENDPFFTHSEQMPVDEHGNADVLTAAGFRRFIMGRYLFPFADSAILHPPYIDTKVMSLT